MNTKTKYSKNLNKTDWQITIVFYITYAIILYLDFDENEIRQKYIIALFSNFFLSLFSILAFIYWIIPKFIIQKKRLILFSFFAVLVLAITGSIDYLIYHILKENNLSNFSLSIQLVVDNVYRLSETTGLLLGVLLTKKFYESLMVIDEIEQARKENELKLLRNQLNPHFLFNNLNNLNSLIDTDKELAKEYTNRLSKIYRYLIKTKDNDIIELQKEIDLAENYIFLIKTRFDKSYHFNINNKADSLKNKLIPTGALQTLLENIIKHNKTTLKITVKVTITITNETITVYNTKTQLNAEVTSFGTGLRNLQKRYKNLTDKSIIIDDNKDYFSVTIPVIKLLKR